MMVHRIDIATLTPSMATRMRASAVFEQLRSLVPADALVELEIRPQAVSMSFLDELVRQLFESGQLDNVTFAIHAEDDLHKLARISDMRSAQVHYLGVDSDARKLVTPFQPQQQEWTIEDAPPVD